MNAPEQGHLDLSNVYAGKVNPCGCRSVPEGTHLPGCPEQRVPTRSLDPCTNCGYRVQRVAGVCSACGAGVPDADDPLVGAP